MSVLSPFAQVGEASIKQIRGANGESQLSFSLEGGKSTTVPSLAISHLSVEENQITMKFQDPIEWQAFSEAEGLDTFGLVAKETELHTVLSTLRWWLPHVVVTGTLPQQLDPDPVILNLEGISLTARDLELLGDEQCLNDSVLDFFLKLAVEVVAPEHLKGDLYVASTFFFQKLTAGGVENGEAGWQNVRRWTRSLPHGLLGQRFVILPINEQNIHWWLAVVCHARYAIEPEADGASFPLGKTPRIVCLDSAQEPLLKHRAVAFLRGYLWKEWCERHPSATPEEPDKVNELINLKAIAAEVPKQANGFDCGIFIIEYLLHLLQSKSALAGLGLARHKHWFGQKSVTFRRKRLKWIAQLLQHHAERFEETDVGRLLQEPKLKKSVAQALTEVPDRKEAERFQKAVDALRSGKEVDYTKIRKEVGPEPPEESPKKTPKLKRGAPKAGAKGRATKPKVHHRPA